MRLVVLLLASLAFAPLASAHGDLAIHELETLAIRDFEGMEDSFPWGGFEIWDVYVGEGYNETLDADGVYFKINLAGDGTMRAPGQQEWTVTVRFAIGEATFERSFAHDGETITTDFESLQWMVADGNVLQVKAWVPVPNAAGQSVTDLVVVSAVDGEARDTAPGGVHAPVAGAEVPVTGPATPIFPPLGEGRVVDEVPLTGPGKLFQVAVSPTGDGSFVLTLTNALAEQGQHIHVRPAVQDGWNVTLPKDATLNLKGGAAGNVTVSIRPDAPAGTVLAPLRLDLVSDIGGRRTLLAFLEDGQVRLAETDAAQPASVPQPLLEAPATAVVAALAAVGVVALARRR